MNAILIVRTGNGYALVEHTAPTVDLADVVFATRLDSNYYGDGLGVLQLLRERFEPKPAVVEPEPLKVAA